MFFFHGSLALGSTLSTVGTAGVPRKSRLSHQHQAGVLPMSSWRTQRKPWCKMPKGYHFCAASLPLVFWNEEERVDPIVVFKFGYSRQ